MKPYKSNESAEPIIRRGRVVPEGSINLAYVKAPQLSPAKNLIMLDVSQIAARSPNEIDNIRGIYYANSIGVLEDESGNQAFVDEFPAISDVFRVDTNPTVDDILPYLHVSRYFHLDSLGISTLNVLTPHRTNKIKIVDLKGRNYTDTDNNLLYRTYVVPADVPSHPVFKTSAYRLFVFLAEQRDDLKLYYERVDVHPDGTFSLIDSAHNEYINSRSYFEYRPEESEVVDHYNRLQKIYSSRPVNLKQHIIGQPAPYIDGYRVFAPRKAIADPRLFELFRWRVTCQFGNNLDVDIVRPRIVNCGIVVTNATVNSDTPYPFYNLQSSQYNNKNLQFVNPLGEGDSITSAYWYVNIDTLSTDDLKNYDLLVWTPPTPEYDFSPYIHFINTFTNLLGKTLIIDTDNYTVPTGLGINTTHGVYPGTGVAITDTGDDGYAIEPFGVDLNSNLITGKAINGWDVTSDTDSISYVQKTFNFAKVQFAYEAPNYKVLMRGANLEASQALIQYSDMPGGGRIMFSTIGWIHSCSALFSQVGETMLDNNTADSITNIPDYVTHLSSPVVVGAMKLLYNVLLYSISNQDLGLLTNPSGTNFASRWAYSTPWKASWIIDGDVLTDQERIDNHFEFLPKSFADQTAIWQRRLDSKTVDQLIESSLSPQMSDLMRGADREYKLEVTNQKVSFSNIIGPNSSPYVWTDSFSPSLNIPLDFGPYKAIPEPIEGKYEDGIFVYKETPPKPYKVNINAQFTASWDRPGKVSIEYPSYTIEENDLTGSLSVNIIRSEGAGGAVTIDWFTEDGTAKHNVRYVATSGTLSWAHNEQGPKTVTIPIINDFLNEGNQVFYIKLTNPTSQDSFYDLLVGNALATVTVIDDERPGVLQFTEATRTMPETFGQVLVRVSRLGGRNGEVSCKFTYSGGTATYQQDWQYGHIFNPSSGNTILTGPAGEQAFTDSSPNLTQWTQPDGVVSYYAPNQNILAGNVLGLKVYRDHILTWPDMDMTQKYFIVESISDRITEPDETINFTLSDPTNLAEIGTQKTCTVTIVDDDFDETVTWSAEGHYDQVVQATPGTPATTREVELTWVTHGSGQFFNVPGRLAGVPLPVGVTTWHLNNYGKCNNYAYSGFYGKYSEGTRSPTVAFIREILRSLGYSVGAASTLYTSTLENAVRAFQIDYKAKYIDGIVDAETSSMLSYRIIAHGWQTRTDTAGGLFDPSYWHLAVQACDLRNISDGNINTLYGDRTWVNTGNRTWDTYVVTLAQPHTINKIRVIPWVANTSTPPEGGSLIIQSAGIFGDTPDFASWNGQSNGVSIQSRVNSNAIWDGIISGTGKCFWVSLAQDKSYLNTGAEQFGVHDMRAITTVATPSTPGTPGSTTDKIIKVQGTSVVHPDRPTTVRVSAGKSLTNLRWTSVTLVKVTNSKSNATVYNIIGTIAPNGLLTLTQGGESG